MKIIENKICFKNGLNGFYGPVARTGMHIKWPSAVTRDQWILGLLMCANVTLNF